MPDLNKLSIEDRLKLVQDIWDSIAIDSGDVSIDPAHIAEMRKRLATYRRDPEKGERAREAAETIRSRL